MKKLKSSENMPLAETAYRKIKQAIIECHFSPGLQAAEQQIATQLNMSRTPVHQAIVMLEQEGWVRLLPRKGIQIAPITTNQMKNVYQVLMALESAAVLQLASKDINDTNVDKMLYQASQKAEIAFLNDDIKGWAQADDEFHSVLIEGCGNPYLSKMARSVMEHAHRARLLTVAIRSKESIEKANQDHKEILTAIKERNSQEARLALENHRYRGMEVFIPILEKASWLSSNTNSPF
ncbi:GntR family transcriptional regulator [Halomonas sp. QX-2]|uniref:GntR family transcriptional regulator n=1 Tax=Vreelandella sedimenti TaxID=2729618 RepID=A0A7Z0N8T2_9GAMM|nr:GntR family transcriptional regulator [Halomonas sedimenti]NYT73742.1 GntR family transcriptional regulator [Halomonas sedimenti]